MPNQQDSDILLMVRHNKSLVDSGQRERYLTVYKYHRVLKLGVELNRTNVGARDNVECDIFQFLLITFTGFSCGAGEKRAGRGAQSGSGLLQQQRHQTQMYVGLRVFQSLQSLSNCCCCYYYYDYDSSSYYYY